MTVRRIFLFLLSAVAIALVAAVLLVRHYAQPEKVAAALIGQARDRLGLDLSFTGEPRYAFWPQLSLELDGVSLRAPGAEAALLNASRAGIVLPWSSLRSETIAIEMLRLETPMLDLDAARAWSAGSAGGPTPDIRARLLVADGTILRQGQPFVAGLALDGQIDLQALAGWWDALAAHAEGALPLPPAPLTARIERIDAGGAKVQGVSIEVRDP